ncbi:hypothetical protein DHW03_16510 [Pedobacter yonginense]|uniref:Glycosyl transferase family 1 domain-containing protein n=1 Tax=Pedobacter yonginense TaxID=651869 RepID=A0A317EKL3_9SPHI|nr:glycosyltransferase [Pedobacter yonginense]PWS26383.1 hypothetical protein DHW03_16510 [Pedobacter yonginense]
MKIIHITPSYKPAYIYGGPIQSVGKLCEAIKKSCSATEKNSPHNFENEPFEIEVLTTTANGRFELDMEAGKPQIVDGVPVTYFNRWTKDHSHFSPSMLLALRKRLKNNKGKNLIIHIHAWWNLASILSCWMAKWYKIPVILSPRGMLTGYTMHNRNSFPKKMLHQFMGKNLLKYVYLHATSEQEKTDILQMFQPKSITTIPNLVDYPVKSVEDQGKGIEDQVASIKYQVASIEYQVTSIEEQALSRKYQIESDGNNEVISTFQMIFLSRIEEKKGLELLFEALSYLNFTWTLSIAGSGKAHYVNYLKNRAENLGISNRIKWLGHVSNEDKFNVLSVSDLSVLTSYNENFANVVIESLSVGTAVLISNSVGLADYVATKNLGWISTLNPIEIAEQIKLSYHDSAKRGYIRAHAPAQIALDFDDNTLVKQYFKLYQSIVNG